LKEPDQATGTDHPSLLDLSSLDLMRWVAVLRELSLDAATNTLPFVHLDTGWWLEMRPAVREMLTAAAEVGAKPDASGESRQALACALRRMEEVVGVPRISKLIQWGRGCGIGGDIVGSIGAGSAGLLAVEVSLSLKHDVEPYNWLLRDHAFQALAQAVLHLYAKREDLQEVVFSERLRWPSSAWDVQCDDFYRRQEHWSPESLLLHLRSTYDRLMAAWFWQQVKRVLGPLQRRKLTRAYVREHPEFSRMFSWGVRFLEEIVVPDGFVASC